MDPLSIVAIVGSVFSLLSVVKQTVQVYADLFDKKDNVAFKSLFNNLAAETIKFTSWLHAMGITSERELDELDMDEEIRGHLRKLILDARKIIIEAEEAVPKIDIASSKTKARVRWAFGSVREDLKTLIQALASINEVLRAYYTPPPNYKPPRKPAAGAREDAHRRESIYTSADSGGNTESSCDRQTAAPDLDRGTGVAEADDVRPCSMIVLGLFQQAVAGLEIISNLETSHERIRKATEQLVNFRGILEGPLGLDALFEIYKDDPGVKGVRDQILYLLAEMLILEENILHSFFESTNSSTHELRKTSIDIRAALNQDEVFEFVLRRPVDLPDLRTFEVLIKEETEEIHEAVDELFEFVNIIFHLRRQRMLDVEESNEKQKLAAAPGQEADVGRVVDNISDTMDSSLRNHATDIDGSLARLKRKTDEKLLEWKKEHLARLSAQDKAEVTTLADELDRKLELFLKQDLASLGGEKAKGKAKVEFTGEPEGKNALEAYQDFVLNLPRAHVAEPEG